MKKMRVISMILAVVMALVCFAGCSGNSGSSDYIATYDGQKVSLKLFSFFAEYIKDMYAQQYGYASEPVDESEYMTLKHILVNFEKEDGTTRTEEEALAEAQNIKAMITDDNFDELMAQYSEDPGSQSSPEGYTFAHNDGTMMQEFDDGGWALEVGQVSEPVKTSYGYHVIKRVELNKEALPQVINWDEEISISEEEKTTHIELVKEDAYSMLSRYVIFSDIARDNGKSLSDEEYETEKEMINTILGGEEAAKTFFEKIEYTEEEIKELVEIISLADTYVSEYVESVNCEELFDEFIASEYYAELQVNSGLEYTEYDAENEEMISAIQSYAFNKLYDAETAKVEKNEEIYNQYK